MRKYRIRRLLRKSGKLINHIQWLLIKDKQREPGKSFYVYQTKAIEEYKEAVNKAYNELVKKLIE